MHCDRRPHNAPTTHRCKKLSISQSMLQAGFGVHQGVLRPTASRSSGDLLIRGWYLGGSMSNQQKGPRRRRWPSRRSSQGHSKTRLAPLVGLKQLADLRLTKDELSEAATPPSAACLPDAPLACAAAGTGVPVLAPTRESPRPRHGLVVFIHQIELLLVRSFSLLEKPN